MSDLGFLMTLSVTDSFLHKEVSGLLYLNADERATEDPSGMLIWIERPIYMQPL